MKKENGELTISGEGIYYPKGKYKVMPAKINCPVCNSKITFPYKGYNCICGHIVTIGPEENKKHRQVHI